MRKLGAFIYHQQKNYFELSPGDEADMGTRDFSKV